MKSYIDCFTLNLAEYIGAISLARHYDVTQVMQPLFRVCNGYTVPDSWQKEENQS